MTYLISDIHGEYDLLKKLLTKINFSKVDELIVLGDMIDKGKQSLKVVKFLMSQSNVSCILGNHEYVFLKVYWSIMRESPSDFDAVLQRMQHYFPFEKGALTWEIIDWIENLPLFIERENFICVHAGVELNEKGEICDLKNTLAEIILYDRDFKNPNLIHSDKRCVFFGHTPTCFTEQVKGVKAYKRRDVSGKKIQDYYKVNLDAGVWVNGVLGCFCVDNCQSYYVEK